jgi:hypothetical protein
MSVFDERWRRLAAAARRAPEAPFAPPPRLAFERTVTRTLHSPFERWALRGALALAGAAYALAAWLLPLAREASATDLAQIAALARPPATPALFLPRPPRLPTPERTLDALVAASDSLCLLDPPPAGNTP